MEGCFRLLIYSKWYFLNPFLWAIYWNYSIMYSFFMARLKDIHSIFRYFYLENSFHLDCNVVKCVQRCKQFVTAKISPMSLQYYYIFWSSIPIVVYLDWMTIPTSFKFLLNRVIVRMSEKSSVSKWGSARIFILQKIIFSVALWVFVPEKKRTTMFNSQMFNCRCIAILIQVKDQVPQITVVGVWHW